MPNDDDDLREITPTLAPDTEPTRSENQIPERRDAIAPQAPAPSIAPQTADSMFLSVVKDITDAARIIREDAEARRAYEAAQLDLQRQVLAAVERAERNSDANWSSMHGQLESWRKVSQDKDADHDKRIQDLEAQVEKLEAKLLEVLQGELLKLLEPIVKDVETIKSAIAELKAHATSPPAKSPAAPAE
jgi:hypothetical protein